MRECDYSPLKAALEKLSIPDVWQMLGLQGRPMPSCKSPFRDERNASFSIYAQCRHWKDHTTGEGGDAADFCAHARGLSQEEGARLLIDLAGTRRVDSVPKGNSGNAKWQGNPSRPGPGNPGPIRSPQGPGKGPQARRLAALRAAHTSGDRDSRHASRIVRRGRRYRR